MESDEEDDGDLRGTADAFAGELMDFGGEYLVEPPEVFRVAYAPAALQDGALPAVAAGAGKRPAVRAPGASGVTPDPKRPNVTIWCACCGGRGAADPRHCSGEKWRWGKLGWRLAAVVAVGAWIPRVHCGDVRLCPTCCTCVSTELAAALVLLLSSREQVDLSSGPVGPLLCSANPLRLRDVLRELQKEYRKEPLACLQRRLASLPAGLGVGLLPAPLGGVVTIYRSMIPGENEPGGRGKLRSYVHSDGEHQGQALVKRTIGGGDVWVRPDQLQRAVLIVSGACVAPPPPLPLGLPN